MIFSTYDGFMGHSPIISRGRSVYTIKCYSDTTKKEMVPFVTTWVNPEGIMLRELSQTKKDKCRMVSLICGL